MSSGWFGRALASAKDAASKTQGASGGILGGVLSSVAEAATLTALNMGYTHIDTALGYLNQDGIARAIKSSGRSRSSFFITSKIPGGLSEKDAASNLTLAVSQLGLDYVDLMLVHFPATWGGKGGKEMRQATWRAIE